jgi:hypothetical protein
MGAQAEKVNVHQSAAQPLTDPAHKRLSVPLAQFRDDVRCAAGCKVFG